MKKVTKILFVVAAVIFLFAACGKAEEEPIDVSDIKDMVFWSEEPLILYYGEGKVIIDGDFGAAVYDLENRRLTDRVSFDQIHEWGMVGYGNFASADGETIYFTDMQQNDGVMTSYVSYDVESRTVSGITEMTEEGFPKETFGSKRKHYDPAEYEKHFQKYKDEGCLIGENSVLLENGEFVFLSMRDGIFYELEVIVCGSDGGEKVYRVFDSADRDV